MFENSLRIVDECDLTYLHVFPFLSPARHAGCAHAAIAQARHQGPRPRACARRARQRLDEFLGRNWAPCARSWSRPKTADAPNIIALGEICAAHERRCHRPRQGHRPRQRSSRGEPRRMSFFKKLFNQVSGREHEGAASAEDGVEVMPPAPEPPPFEPQVEMAAPDDNGVVVEPSASVSVPQQRGGWFNRLKDGLDQIIALTHRIDHRDLHQAQARCGNAGRARGRADPVRSRRRDDRPHRQSGRRRTL